MQGLLLVGHGTRDVQGQAEFLTTARLVAQRTGALDVEAGFLELCAPTIGDALQRLYARGVRRVTTMPLMLLAAGHVKRDIPLAVDRAAATLRGFKTYQASHLGCHPAIVQLSALRFEEALAGAPHCGADRTALLLVGRGSADDEAIAEMSEFARIRARHAPAAHVGVCYLAMAQPSLSTALQQLAWQGLERIVVQPHLLFRGELLDQVRLAVAAAGRRFPQRQWFCTDALGASELLVSAVVELATIDEP